MKVAYLGPEGTFTEAALDEYMPDANKVAFPSIGTTFRALSDHEGIFVPIENLIKGTVVETLDNLYEQDLKVIGSYVMPVNFAMGGLPGANIERILSKDIALLQCSDFIEKKYPDAIPEPCSTTAGGMDYIAKRKDTTCAAIGMEKSIEKYGLEVFHRNIGNIPNNKTRFVMIGNGISEPTGDDQTIISVYPKEDRPGFLLGVLNIISKKYGLNMTTIDSRPDGVGGYRFYIDVAGHVYDKNIRNCIDDLEKISTNVKFLGSYPSKGFNKPLRASSRIRDELGDSLINTIGIIGGTGEMGEFLVPFMNSLGYNVKVGSRKPTEGKSCSYEECVDGSEAILVNVPIEHTLSTVDALVPYLKSGQLLVDNTGVKSGILEEIVKKVPQGVEVSSIHTFFRKPKYGLSIVGENVLTVQTSLSGRLAEEFNLIFKTTDANVTESTPEEHDICASMTQGLQHASAIAQARTILDRTLGDMGILDSFSTPNYRRSEESIKRIHQGDPMLYETMMKTNPYFLLVLNEYIKNLESISEGIGLSTNAVQEMFEKNRVQLTQE